MTDNLAEYLSSHDIDFDTLLQVIRYLIAEESSDLTVEEMRDEMIARAAEPDQIAYVIGRITTEPERLEELALWVLASLWAEHSRRDQLRVLVAESEAKMPVVEVGILATSVLYGSYLLLTRGVRRTETTVKRKADGTYEIRTVTEYTDPTRLVGYIASIFRRLPGS